MIRLALIVALALAACGRAGPPRPAGPREEVTYPYRVYPAPDPPLPVLQSRPPRVE